MTAEKKAELLACPMCGKDDNEDNAIQQAAVVCCRVKAATGGAAEQVQCVCGVKGPVCATYAEAVAAWNTRAPSPPASGEVERADNLETRLWSIIDQNGFAQVPSDIVAAVERLCRQAAGAAAVPEGRTHTFVPHPKHPQFCWQCGYPEHERLQHTAEKKHE